jgi:hypothetical protein
MARLNWGMIGGGEGSQIGPAHRISAAMDGLYTLAAGALDADPARGRDFAQRLGVAPDRAYGDWREMLAGERRGIAYEYRGIALSAKKDSWDGFLIRKAIGGSPHYYSTGGSRSPRLQRAA